MTTPTPTLAATTTHTDPLPVRHVAPLVNPAPGGLFAVTTWTDHAAPLRWLPSGFEIRPSNVGGELASGVWAASWCAQLADLGPDDLKVGARPELLDPFTAITTWAADACDLTADSRAEVRERAQQVHRIREPVMVAREFSTRLLADAGVPTEVEHIGEAVAAIETELAVQNLTGVIHAAPRWLAEAAERNLAIRSAGGIGWTTPGGARWVFDGGYADGLGDVLVVTMPTFGWRGPVELREAIEPSANSYAAISERSLVVTYEANFGAVQIVPPAPVTP